MISGCHMMIFSKDADADRAFLRDVVGLVGIDAGGGWLIFRLPPAELGVHPSDANGLHQMYLMCDDLDAEVARFAAAGAACTPVERQRWGRTTAVPLPGGGKLGLYEPHHPQP